MANISQLSDAMMLRCKNQDANNKFSPFSTVK